MKRCLLPTLLLLACSDPSGPRPDADLGPRPDLARLDRPAAPDRLPLDRGRPDGAITLGSACASDLECSAGMSCVLEWPGGFCARSCATDADCDPSGSKATMACLEGRCHRRCDPRAAFSSCREGYVCRVDGARSLCVPDCRATQGCAKAGWKCESGSGLCIDPASGAVGAACGPTVGGCDGTPNGVCYSLGGFGAGFCTIPCSPFARPCPIELQGSTCLLGSIAAPYCGFICDPKAPQCPHPGMSCESVGEVHVCLP